MTDVKCAHVTVLLQQTVWDCQRLSMRVGAENIAQQCAHMQIYVCVHVHCLHRLTCNMNHDHNYKLRPERNTAMKPPKAFDKKTVNKEL